jgi:hypothetical protein
MKFPEPVRAAEGLTSYARVKRLQWGPFLLNIVEGLFGLAGVILLILAVRYGSFEKAGQTIDQAMAGVKTGVHNLIAHKS